MRIPRYWAFLSYSHDDKAWADWLHHSLETYRVPDKLVGRDTGAGPIPRRLSPIFRDRDELPAATDLGDKIEDALAASRFLIVLCSPTAATSHWANEEILQFKRMHPDGNILAMIVDGEPNASDLAGREAEECFPPALRFELDGDGELSNERAEPIAADAREAGDGKKLAKLKLIAGMLGVGLDELVEREAQRRQKRLAIVAAASLAGMVVTSGLAVVALQARNEAQEQRAEAEGLIGFMLGSLRKELEPLGRLEVLDSVGERALDYYQKQDKGSLTEDGLAQRSKALTLMGEIAQLRGDTSGALTRYRVALAGTAEAMNRAPEDGQRVFDHAQNVFWVGSIALQRGQKSEAGSRFREYKRLAERLVLLDPSKQEWRFEVLSADTNLGMLLLEDGKFAHAAAAFESALGEAEKLVAAAPRDRRYQDSVSETLAYLADARRKSGKLEDALASRERQLEVLKGMIAMHGGNADLTRRMMVTRQALANLFTERGDVDTGIAHFRTATVLADELRQIEPDNTEWLRVSSGMQADYAQLMLAIGRAGDAEPLVRASCDTAKRLAQRDASVVDWRFERIGRCLHLQAEASAVRGRRHEALAIARQATALGAQDRRVGRRQSLWSIAAQRLGGDQSASMGDSVSARHAWLAALASIESGPGTPQHEMERYMLLRRLDRDGEARDVAGRLDAIGYRHPSYFGAKRS